MRGLTGIALAAAAGLQGVPAQANEVRLDSTVFRETVSRENGERVRRIEQANSFRRGDRVITILYWEASREEPFWVSSAVPPTLILGEAPDGAQALMQDGRITQLRWRVDPVRAGSRGRFSYAATVR